MPFLKLVDSHSCPLPKTREDGSSLQIGDVWQCDDELTDGSGRRCQKIYRYQNDQREGNFWMPQNTRGGGI